jgi:hypothetical protein
MGFGVNISLAPLAPLENAEIAPAAVATAFAATDARATAVWCRRAIRCEGVI